MKSKHLQNIVLSKYQKDDARADIHRHLNGRSSLAKIKSWCQMIYQTATRYMCWFADNQGTKENIQKLKNCLHRKQKVSARILLRKLGISEISVRRLLKIDLRLKP